MKIQQLNTPKLPNLGRVQIQQQDTPPPPPPSTTMVDRIIDKTYLGANFTASALSGGLAGAGAFLRSAPGAAVSTTASFYKNFWKTETIGPNLKIIGSVLALPVAGAATVLGLPVSLCVGLYQGADEVDSSKPRQFTIGAAAREGYNVTREGWAEMAKSARESFTEMGEAKLEPGEKPLDIPLIKTAKTLAVGVASAAVGGVAGVVSACVGSLRESLVGIGRALSDESLSLPGKVVASGAALIGGVVHGATYGVTTGLSVLGTGIGETWKRDSLIEGGREAFSNAYHSVAAAAAPKATLLQEKTEPKP